MLDQPASRQRECAPLNFRLEKEQHYLNKASIVDYRDMWIDETLKV